MQTQDHFSKIFWFIVGLCLFGAAISSYAVYVDKSHIAMVLTFWLSTAVSGGIGYLIGSSMQKAGKPQEPGTTTLEANISATTGTTN
jgi:hypothetical protein